MQTNKVATIAKRPMTIPQYTPDISHTLARTARVLLPMRLHIAMQYTSSALPRCISFGWSLETTPSLSFNVRQPGWCRPTLPTVYSRHMELVSVCTVVHLPYILD